MVDYLYDGSFEGLLTCVYLHYYEEPASGVFLESQYQSDLLRPYKCVVTSLTCSDKVYFAIRKKISPLALQNTYYLYLSNHIHKEMLVLEYLKKGFKIGISIDDQHADPLIHDIHILSKKVLAESHRFLGLIRFTDTGVFLYSAIQPDHNILILLGDHFSDRLKNEKFIIHDQRRSKALISSDGIWYITDFDSKTDFPLQKKEEYYRSLWKNYYNHIGIGERKNPKLQAQYMPRRYWKNLTEI